MHVYQKLAILQNMMNCIVIEDEPAAQSILENNIARCSGLHCSGIFRDAFSAQEFLDSYNVDLIFLDINLPEMSGVTFLRTLVNPPLVVFTTAYPQYAIDGFDLEIIDFLLKPFSFERFCKAVNKAKEKFNARKSGASFQKISVKSDRRIYQIDIDEILFIEALGDYVSIYCTNKKLIVHGTLKGWEDKLKGLSFQKIHRTSIVNIQKIDHIEGNMIFLANHKLSMSENFRKILLEKML